MNPASAARLTNSTSRSRLIGALPRSKREIQSARNLPSRRLHRRVRLWPGKIRQICRFGYRHWGFRHFVIRVDHRCTTSHHQCQLCSLSADIFPSDPHGGLMTSILAHFSPDCMRTQTRLISDDSVILVSPNTIAADADAKEAALWARSIRISHPPNWLERLMLHRCACVRPVARSSRPRCYY